METDHDDDDDDSDTGDNDNDISSDDDDEDRCKLSRFEKLGPTPEREYIRATRFHLERPDVRDTKLLELDVEWIEKRSLELGLKFPLEKQQAECTRFLLRNSFLGRGSIGAHEMGLGKTLATLAAVVLHGDLTGDSKVPCLVVTPGAVDYNWVNECNKFYGHRLRVLHVQSHGKLASCCGSDRRKLKPGELTAELISKHDIVVCTYGTVWAPWKQAMKTVLARCKGLYKCDAQGQREFLESFDDLQFPKGMRKIHAKSRSVPASILPNNRSTRLVGAMLAFPWRWVVFDEGDLLSNAGTWVAQACYALRAETKVILSGTPKRNYIDGMWSMLNIIRAQNLPSYKEFQKAVEWMDRYLQTKRQRTEDTVSLPREFAQIYWRAAQDMDRSTADGRLTAICCSAIQWLLSEHMHVLTKNMIAAQIAATSPAARQRYDAEVTRYRNYVLVIHSIPKIPCLYRRDIGIPMSESMAAVHGAIRSKRLDQMREMELLKRGGDSTFRHLMATLVYLRELCSLPSSVPTHVYHEYCDAPDVVSVFDEGNQKLMIIKEMLTQWTDFKGQPGVIFTYFVKTAEFLHRQLTERLGIGARLVHGKFDGEERAKICDEFQWKDTDQVLVASRCIGVGINLTRARWILLYDGSWNSAQEMQMISRAHRMGQKNEDVLCVGLYYRGGIEERMREVCKIKDTQGDGMNMAQLRQLV